LPGEVDPAELYIPVDQASNRWDTANDRTVYSEGALIYDVMLNQTDVSYGTFGHNKFYVIQMIEVKKKPKRKNPKRPLKVSYEVINRWGRVGEYGANGTHPFDNVDQAKSDFQKKYSQKSGGNTFGSGKFQKKKDKYDLIEKYYQLKSDQIAAPTQELEYDYDSEKR